jgi:hypothetical protein
MLLVTRAQWGARPSRYPLVHIGSTRGVKVHYEGTAVPADLAAPEHHTRCDDRMRDLQRSHLANTREDYSDIAYNYVACPHGYTYEGRGLHHKTAANGNQTLNMAHYAVCAMVGSEGLTHPTDAQLAGIRDAIELLRLHGGAGDEIRGHRDGYATACPGGPLYAWVQAGAKRPAGAGGAKSPAEKPAPSARPRVDLSHVVAAAKRDPNLRQGGTTYKAEVLRVERALHAEGLLAEKWVDGSFGTRTLGAYTAWQKRCGYHGSAADGIPGKASLKRLGDKHGFTVVD